MTRKNLKDLFKFTFTTGETYYHIEESGKYRPSGLIFDIGNLYRNDTASTYPDGLVKRIGNDIYAKCELITSDTINNIVLLEKELLKKDTMCINGKIIPYSNKKNKKITTVPKRNSILLRNDTSERLYVEREWLNSHKLNGSIISNSVCPLNKNFLEVSIKLERI